MTEDFSELKLSGIAGALKVLGHPLRLKVLLAIYTRKCKVSGLVECIEEPQPIISQQLAILRKAKIISGKKDKNCVIYNIVDETARQIIHRIADENKLLCAEFAKEKCNEKK